MQENLCFFLIFKEKQIYAANWGHIAQKELGQSFNTTR